MAALCGGAFVTHVDAAKGCVQWARRNAEASKGPSPPVRWICDDARTFVRREVKRGRQYAGVILDPPSYGHGPGGEPWRLEKDLSELLDGVAALTRSSRRFVLLTCHTPGYGPVELASLIAQTMNVDRNEIESGEQSLAASDGRRLFAGTFARWSVGPRSRPNIIEA